MPRAPTPSSAGRGRSAATGASGWCVGRRPDPTVGRGARATLPWPGPSRRSRRLSSPGAITISGARSPGGRARRRRRCPRRRLVVPGGVVTPGDRSTPPWRKPCARRGGPRSPPATSAPGTSGSWRRGRASGQQPPTGRSQVREAGTFAGEPGKRLSLAVDPPPTPSTAAAVAAAAVAGALQRESDQRHPPPTVRVSLR